MPKQNWEEDLTNTPLGQGLKEAIEQETWEEELKELEIIIPDGKLKDVLVYHEAVYEFISKLLSQTEQEVKERILSKLPEEAPHGSVSEYYSGFNACLKEITKLINKF